MHLRRVRAVIITTSSNAAATWTLPLLAIFHFGWNVFTLRYASVRAGVQAVGLNSNQVCRVCEVSLSFQNSSRSQARNSGREKKMVRPCCSKSFHWRSQFTVTTRLCIQTLIFSVALLLKNCLFKNVQYSIRIIKVIGFANYCFLEA